MNKVFHSSAPECTLPSEVCRKVLGHLDDVLLGAELVLVAEDVLLVDVVLVQKGLHPGPLLRRHTDAKGREHVGHNLKRKGISAEAIKPCVRPGALLGCQ